MFPTGHIEYTWAALNVLQRKTGLLREADYRWMALAATAPDLLDKPLALTIYRHESAALFWGHNLWLHIAVWTVALAGTRWVPAFSTGERRQGAARPGFGAALPYLLAFSGHLVADRMWGFQESLFYPLGAGHWHPWVHVGEPAAMLGAYYDIARSTPILIFFEVSGLGLLGWFILDRRLWQRARLVRFLRHGQVDGPDGEPCEGVPDTLGREARGESQSRLGRAYSIAGLFMRWLAGRVGLSGRMPPTKLGV